MAQESWKMEQEEAGCQHPEGPLLCINKCGFFGSAATMNLCSKCYRDIILKQSNTFPVKVPGEGFLAEQGEKPFITAVQDYKTPAASFLGDLSMHTANLVLRPEQPQLPVTPVRPVARPGSSSSDGTIPQDKHPSSSRTPHRCFSCRKRVGLTGFKCRCGDIFCPLHRYSDKHHCSFDYKAAGRDAIAKANPVVKAQKIEKI